MAQQQYMFFDTPRPATSLPAATKPNIVVANRRRLSSQNKQILERLKRGPATNRELNRIVFRYSARIFELRGHGYDITTTQVKRGLWTYKLIVAGEK